MQGRKISLDKRIMGKSMRMVDNGLFKRLRTENESLFKLKILKAYFGT